jgi:hypothetical protein
LVIARAAPTRSVIWCSRRGEAQWCAENCCVPIASPADAVVRPVRIGVAVEHPDREMQRLRGQRRVREADALESALWEQAAQRLGPAPEDEAVVWGKVCDRGGDIYDHLCHCQHQHQRFVIRTTQNRVVVTAEGQRAGKLVETARGWKELRTLALRKNTGRFLHRVRIWKGGNRRINVSMYKLARNGFRTVTWYVVSSLPAKQERFVEYACRWWQECGFKGLKSALFDWERGRVIEPERVEVLLIGISCALWAMWLLGST